MSAGSPWGRRLVMPLVLLAALLAPSGLSGQLSAAAPATPQLQVTVQPGPLRAAALATPPAQATVQRGAGRVGQSPTLVGDINNDGIVDIRDYGLWRLAFGATACGNPADLDGNCIVDIRDYGIWRTNFGHVGPAGTGAAQRAAPATGTATPTPIPSRTPTGR